MWNVHLIDPDRLVEAVVLENCFEGFGHPVGVGGCGIDVSGDSVEVVAIGLSGGVGLGGVEDLREELGTTGVAIPVECGTGDDDLGIWLNVLDAFTGDFKELIVGSGVASPRIERTGRIPDVWLIPNNP